MLQSRAWPHLLEKLEPCRHHARRRSADAVLNGDKTMIIGVLPNRKHWTRHAPSIHRFLIGALSSGEPFEQVKNENLQRCSRDSYFMPFRDSRRADYF